MSGARKLPRPCPACGSEKGQFGYTEPSYGDAWKCGGCGLLFTGWNNSAAKYLLMDDELVLSKSSVYMTKQKGDE